MKALRLNDFPSSMLDDAALVARILSGEKALFEILMRRYNQTLYRVIRGYLKNETGEVEDAMQNTYLKAYDKLWQFRGDASFSTWLIRIGINEALLRLRKIRREKKLYVQGTGVGDEIQIEDRQMNPEMLMIHGEGERLVELAIDSLPEKYRVVYILREVEGLSTAEIAECLGLTHDNVKVRVHRANKMLKEGLLRLTRTVSVFEFGNSRCDRLVDFVMRHLP